MIDHQVFMRRALDLALIAEGRTSPNPMVGAVIVKDGKIIGEGHHTKAGEPHAEVEALRACSESPQGAVMYVSLEPCCNHNRTPPCTNALIKAGIAEVHYAVPDENPKVWGGGHKQLEKAGLRVFRGPLEQEGRFLNRAFFRYITSNRPYVTAKYAMSLDGKIATHSGDSKWITGESARVEGHRLRHISDVVIIGAGTVLADNPRLTSRLEGVVPNHPVRVVLDSKGRVPVDSAIFDLTLAGQTMLATTAQASMDHRARLADKGVDVLMVEANPQGRINLNLLLTSLAQRNTVRVMVEGGAQVLGAFNDAQLIDEAWVFLGGKMIGGQNALGPLGGAGANTIGETSSFRIYNGSALDDDFLVKAVRL